MNTLHNLEISETTPQNHHNMAEILLQLIGSLSHNYPVLYIRGGTGFLPSTVSVGKFAIIQGGGR